MNENEENKTVETPSTETNYIEVIQNLKQNSVSKAEYERVIQENKTLANALVTSQPVSTETADEPVHTQEEIDTLSEKLSRKSLTNLDYITTALDLRDAILSVYGTDPFLPNNNGYVATDEDVEKAATMAEGLRQIVNYSQGDPKLFNSELKRCCK